MTMSRVLERTSMKLNVSTAGRQQLLLDPSVVLTHFINKMSKLLSDSKDVS